MNVPRLIYYAIASFFLGSIAVVAVAAGGTAVIESVMGFDAGPPLNRLMVGLTIFAPVFFLVLAIVEAFRPSDRP